MDRSLKIPKHSSENQFGQYKSIGDHKGRVLLVDFWYDACTPCLKDMKHFPELLAKYDSELSIMSISIDPKERTQHLLDKKQKRWDFLVSDNPNWTFYNDQKITSDLGVTQFPTYLLFDEEGELIRAPSYGIAAVEYHFDGFFGLKLFIKSHKAQRIFKVAPLLITLYYTVLFLIVLGLYFAVKKIRSKLSS